MIADLPAIVKGIQVTFLGIFDIVDPQAGINKCFG
jgi:hypothetical protein